MDHRLNDLQLYCIEEFVENYRDGLLTRRDMLRRVLAITGGVATTATLLLSLGCAPTPPATPTPIAPTSQPTTAPAAAQAAASSGARSPLSVRADDPTIVAADVSFPGEGATILGYLAQPKATGPFAAVLVCHENRGLVEHIRDVTRRLAKAGYVGLAVDLLSREGGTAKVDPSQAAAKLTANPARNVADFQAGFRYLQAQPYAKPSATGMVGFCFGGGVTWLVAMAIPELKAVVPYYGPIPPLDNVAKIQAAVLGLYGGEDRFVNPGIPAMEKAMKDNGKTFEKIIYPGAGHAFNNDTGPGYNEQAALDAWQKTLSWFKRYLG
jgi:carboxymethylenebutenolidase